MTPLELILTVVLVFMLTVVLLFWLKMGKVARFFAGLSMWAGAGSLFMGLWPTGQVEIWKVHGKGRALRFGKKGFVFIPDILRSPDMKEAGDETEAGDTAREFNELIRTPAYLQGRRLFTGTMSANLAATPALLDALAAAEWKGAKELLKQIKELGEGIEEVYLVKPWTLDKLAEYINISFTQHDIDETYEDGYMKGLSASLGYNKVFLLLVFASLLVVVATVYLMSRTPGT